MDSNQGAFLCNKPVSLGSPTSGETAAAVSLTLGKTHFITASHPPDRWDQAEAAAVQVP